MTDWSSYVAAYHEERPGISEQLLGQARDAEGRSPYDWLAEAVPTGVPVVDLGCGNAPLLRRLPPKQVVAAVDRAAAELTSARAASPGAPLARADASALPLRTASAGAVTASLALMVVTPLVDVLAEVVRVLRPGGTLVATAPMRSAPRQTEVFALVLAALGQAGVRYPNALRPVDLAAVGLVVSADEVNRFVRRVARPGDAELVVRALYAPGATAGQVEAATERLREHVCTGPLDVPFPIRRIVASVPSSGTDLPADRPQT